MPVPNSNSSVRGLSRELSREAVLELRADESCEQMMRRIDERELDAIRRHLFARRLVAEPAR